MYDGGDYLSRKKGVNLVSQLFTEFRNPPSEFSQFPFWFWNDDLEFQKIKTDMQDFKSKGIDGLVIHPRLGLSKRIGYLTETYFDYIHFAVAQAKELDMKIILYDEGMYPSGSAHGKVVAHRPELKAKGCFLTDREGVAAYPYEPEQLIQIGENFLVYGPSGGTIRGVHFGEDDFEDAPAAADLLNRQTTETFIQFTHEAYFKRLSAYFGTTIIGFFTDEPNIVGRNAYSGMIPWTVDMTVQLSQAGIPEEKWVCLFRKPHSIEEETYHEIYKAIIHQRLGQNYYAVLSRWCKEHHISLMGHPESSMDIGLQAYFHIPGQDMVWRWVGPGERGGITGIHSTAAKCSADAARHSGARRNSNEIFGCCGPNGMQWEFTLSDMKWYLDWLFVRGVNMIIPHAFYYSLAGKRMEERPPDVGPNNLWWPEYKRFADYSKRMSWLLTDSVNQTNLAVLCQHDSLPWENVMELYEQQIEFNYLEENYLASLTVDSTGSIHIQRQRYNILMISYIPSESIRMQLDRLEAEGLNVIYGLPSLDLIENQPQLQGQTSDLRYSRILKDSQIFHIFSNEGEEAIEFTWSEYKHLLELDAMTGEVYNYPHSKFLLDPREIKIFTPQNPVSDYATRGRYDLEEVTASIKIDTDGWKDNHHSGTVPYRISIQVTEEISGSYILDLGEVHDWVTYKDQLVFKPPYQIEIDAKDLIEKILIHITNSLTNAYDNQERWSGMKGPLKLYKKHTASMSYIL